MSGAVLLGLFLFGSIWSAQAYENVTNGDIAKRSYKANARSGPVQLAAAEYARVRRSGAERHP